MWATEGTWGVLAAFGAALTPVLFAHGGWQHANHVTGEIMNPNRNLPLSLLIGVGILLAGVPVYYAFRWARRREATAS